jgi:hypothetical protein
MKRASRTFVALTLIICGYLVPLHAQDDEPEKVNTNLGTFVSFPVSSTAQFTNIGWGFVAGAGYNFNERHSLVGEFMWNRLYPTDEALDPLRAASPSSPIDGHSDLYAVTGNYRFEVRGKKLGAYFIGGGGWYHRITSLTRSLASGSGTACVGAWRWWGYTCVAGVVSVNQTLESNSSNAFGGNGGIGFTVKVGEPRYRFYVEVRYHYAPNQNVSTQILPITIGIRY